MQYLPLALQQAVACINYKILDLNDDFSVLKYIEEFEKKKMFNFSFEGNLPFPGSHENSYDKTLFKSVSLSVDFIKQSSLCTDLTLDILHVSSYLSPNNIPKSIFHPLDEDQNQLNTSLYILTKYSLLQKFQYEDEWHFNIHRLVQLSYRYIQNPDGFCEETAKKTLLLTAKNIFSNVYHYIYVLDLIMKDTKHGCSFYFDDETVKETVDYKLCYYEFLKTVPVMLESYVKFTELSVNVKGKEAALYKKVLKDYKDNVGNFILKKLQIRTDFFDHPTYEGKPKISYLILFLIEILE